MAYREFNAAILDIPGGEVCMTSNARPIDLDHLSRQTMGDRELGLELLAMFIHQAHATIERLPDADAKERRELAHRLKGSARSVGATELGEALAELEIEPEDAALIPRIRTLVGEAADFVASIGR